jgi:type II secretory pathway component HofQ
MKRRWLVVTAAAVALLALSAGAATQGGQPAGGDRRGDAWKQAPHGVVVTPAAAPSSAGRPVPVISLSLKDADLVEVVRSLARIAQVNVIFDPGVSGKVTAELVDVRWDHALAVILKTQGLGMELDGRILTVATPTRLAGAR